jgi:hypothetical protein
VAISDFREIVHAGIDQIVRDGVAIVGGLRGWHAVCSNRSGRCVGRVAGWRSGCLEPRSGAAHVDIDARASVHQRPVAVAAGARRRADRAEQRMGLFQGSGQLAWRHRLHAEGLSDGFQTSELAGQGSRGDQGGLVPTEGHDTDRVDRPPHGAASRICQLVRDRIHRRPVRR